MAKNQRLNATITIGGVVSATLGKAVGAVNSKLASLGGGGGFAGAQQRIGTAIERNNARLADARAGIADAVGAYFALQGAIAAPVRAAMDFESAMADVKKVVDFPTPQSLIDFRQGLVDLSREVPITVTGLAEIAAAAGQAGIAGDDLVKFTESAAKIGVAFDITADEAGDAMAKMMTGLGLTVDEVVLLSDAMNHLSNAQASSASEILDVVRRTGAMGKQYGFTAEQVAAFGSAMIASGAQSDVAATSFLNMGRALTRGTSATDRQSAAYAKLGLDAEDVAKRMQKDAVGTTVDVMERIASLPAEMRAAVSSDLFGDEARALGPLLTNLDLLRESVGMVGDETKYAGSAFKEFEVRNKVFASRLQRFRNTMQALAITVGEALLPALTGMMDKLEPVIDLTTRFISEHPDLVANVMLSVGALIAFKGALAAIRFAGLVGAGGALQALSLGMNTIGRAGAHLGGAAKSAIALQTALGAMSGGQTLGTLGKLSVGLRAAVMAVPGVGALASGVAAIGSAVATISAPVWGAFALAAAAIAAAGVAIWKYWDRITSVLSGVATRIGEELAPAFDAVRPVLDWFAPIGGVIAAGWEKAAAAIGAAMDFIGGFFTRETLTEDQKAAAERDGYDFADRLIAGIKALPGKLLALGAEIIQSLWDGMQTVFDGLIAWVGEKTEVVAGKFRAIGSAVRGMFGDETQNANAPNRSNGISQHAVGGSFQRGPIIVGERGPELRFENRAGFIATNRQLVSMARNAAMAGALGSGLAGAPVAALPMDAITAGAGRGASQSIAPSQPVAPPSINVGGITIVAQPGQDARQIADEVLRELARRQRGALYDRGT